MMIRTGTKNLHRFARLNQELRRSFASQTLLSRTDFQNKSTVELREELSKRGIVTGSKKKSILIDKILEDERRRMSSSSPPPRKKGPPSVGRSGTEEVGGSLRSSTSTMGEPVVSSSVKVAARLMSEPDGETPKSAPIQTGSESAALATPKLTMRSEGHQAQVWPASINIPSTPVEEPMGTMIPFIPNNWSSHQQSHAPKMVDLKPSSAEVSTASHPSTLPEGGPTRVVTDRFSPSTDSSSDASQGLANKTGQHGPDEIIFNYLASISLPSFDFSSKKDSSHQSPHPQDEFKFEDRPLNDRERNGLYQVLAFFGGSWLVAGLFGSH
ncbi:hypothetical protein MJO28_006863 [Puccinia striiformis f. sp. tritici]|uniref:SAP domain-containing protein n=2 Tax=Puccinia striiformis TaxID=27350 RepID=A0A2S4W6Q9_9BASI|nr:hypothetical protein Pst134EA_012996 [Puccinia striiformis f. sp. tritici]KAH9453870.1 hypothetical protein Pst134EB_013972 [Puccinia striiformis f. sp. tritici]KAH9465100.1 hypothetical protein Pst134EA_012996 [Puccinia striiformis f. sp. tritici]KAI7951179.1 hypothetical protein MJO28_006863 [Puccinia striiformis f. sp. tritici]POW17451.1 hypothetical protein PSHT_06407 [Puccinia striiformis]